MIQRYLTLRHATLCIGVAAPFYLCYGARAPFGSSLYSSEFAMATGVDGSGGLAPYRDAAGASGYVRCPPKGAPQRGDPTPKVISESCRRDLFSRVPLFGYPFGGQ